MKPDTLPDFAQVPETLLSKRFWRLGVEICEAVKGASPLSEDKQKERFYTKAKEALLLIPDDLEKISWKAIVPSHLLADIEGEAYIGQCLDSVAYPKTGMHGDLNANNVLIDQAGAYWIVDWENSTPNGSLAWDLSWFYCIWKRETPKAPEDIISIYNKSKDKDTDIRETLLIYALMKLRVDLMRHQKKTKTSLDNFFQRISAIMALG